MLMMINVNSGGTGQKPTKYRSDVAWSSLLLDRQWYSNSFWNASAKDASGVSLRSLLSPNIIWLLWQRTSLDKSENKVQVDHMHLKRFYTVKRVQKSVQYVRIYSTK